MGHSIMDLLKKPTLLFLTLGHRGFFHWMGDKTYLKTAFHICMGKKLDLDSPKTFSEKLQWMKLFDRRSEYTQMVDKYEVKKIVEETIGSQYIIPTLGVWNRFDEIEFNKLPEQFVLKCTHDSGGLIICKNKQTLNLKTAKRKMEKCLRKNYYWGQREWPYKNANPRIIAEKYIEESTGELNDYKFFCFNGEVKFFKIDFDRYIEHHANYYDKNCELLPFGEAAYPPIPDRDLKIPNNIYDMMHLAEKLSASLPFARIDFYNVDGRIYFGEITLFPISGLGKYTSDEWDMKIGDMLILPEMRNPS